jgi:hypothetical protein
MPLLDVVRAGLAAKLDSRIVDELLATYVEAKRKFLEGGLRLSEVEGGRFCEAAFRLLQEAASLSVTRLGKQIDSDGTIEKLRQVPGNVAPDSIRLHIPRALRMVYDIRNKRDAAHLADGIDPNKQDATLVAGVLDWVLAEFVRLYHDVPPNEAQRIVEDLVTRSVPSVEAFDDFLKVLNPDLGAGERMLLLLYERGGSGASFDQLKAWAKPRMRRNLSTTLSRLEHDKAFIHNAAGLYRITLAGIAEVERRRLYRV